MMPVSLPTARIFKEIVQAIGKFNVFHRLLSFGSRYNPNIHFFTWALCSSELIA